MSKAEKDIEIWKPIQNYEEYMVSNKGRVKRLAYYNNICYGAKQFRKERIKKSTSGNNTCKACRRNMEPVIREGFSPIPVHVAKAFSWIYDIICSVKAYHA